MPYEPGKIIKTLRTGNNFLIQRSCKGGMGFVYIAEREKDKRLYALKTIREDRISQIEKRDNFIKQFRWESQVWIILGKHQNIVQAHWFDLTSEYKPLLIMEYVEGHPEYGTTLREWIKRKTLDPPTILNFSIRALTGLIYAKQVVREELNMPFIHRDLKPENLLLTEDGTVKVTDFGLVRAFGILEDRIGGTPPYMPPEQWKGEEIEEKTDIYALGCILYEMITAKQLFGRLNRWEIKRRHFEEEPRPLEGILSELNHLILKCLKKESQKRYDSFWELREELQGIHEKLKGERLAVNDAPELFTDEDLNSRGSGFDQLGFHQKAISCYDKAIELNPNDARYYLNRGNAYFNLLKVKTTGEVRKGDYKRAKESYLKALKLNSDLAEAHIGLGNLFSKMGQYKKAIESYTKAETFNPRMVEIYVGRGNNYANLRHYEKALGEYKKATDLNPYFAEVYLNLGNVFLCMNEYERAEENYRQAIGINPQYAEAYMVLAKLYHILGRDEEEIDHLLNKALQINPKVRDE